jgi:hypothetical protein
MPSAFVCFCFSLQGILLTPLSKIVLAGALGTDVLNLLSPGSVTQLYCAHCCLLLFCLLSQGILLTPLSENVLAGALGTDVLNLPGLVGLSAGVGFQLWVASVNYAQNAPEGYNAVKDVRVSTCCCCCLIFCRTSG